MHRVCGEVDEHPKYRTVFGANFHIKEGTAGDVLTVLRWIIPSHLLDWLRLKAGFQLCLVYLISLFCEIFGDQLFSKFDYRSYIRYAEFIPLSMCRFCSYMRRNSRPFCFELVKNSCF